MRSLCVRFLRYARRGAEHVRYLNIYEDGEFDEVQFAAWVEQAGKLPGWSGS